MHLGWDHDRMVGDRTRERPAEYPVANCESGDSITDFVHDAGEVMSEHGGQRQREPGLRGARWSNR